MEQTWRAAQRVAEGVSPSTAQGRLALGVPCLKHSWKTNNRFLLALHRLQKLDNTEAVQPHTMQDFSTVYFPKLRPLPSFACLGNRAPPALPLENSLNNCTPSKILLQVCLVPTDLQIISLQ